MRMRGRKLWDQAILKLKWLTGQEEEPVDKMLMVMAGSVIICVVIPVFAIAALELSRFLLLLIIVVLHYL